MIYEGAFNSHDTCRCCKNKTKALWHIFDDDQTNSKYPRIDEMLMACCSVLVYVNDGLPSHLCEQCLRRLHITYDFQRNVKRIEEELREELGLTENAKNCKLEICKEEVVENSDKPTSLEGFGKCTSQQRSYIQCKTSIKVEPDCLDNSYSLNASGIDMPPDDNSQTLNLDVEMPAISKTCKKTSSQIKSKLQYKCKVCQKVFQSQSYIKNHLFRHLKEKRFKCTTCSCEFRTASSLNLHVKFSCTGKPMFQCDVCNLAFPEELILQIHHKIHNKNVAFQHVLDIEDLQEYQNFIEEIPMQTTCTQELPSSIERSQSSKELDVPITPSKVEHETVQVIAKEVELNSSNVDNEFQCTECGRKFRTRYRYFVHMRQHREKKAIVCKICDKEFKFPGELRRHETTYSGNVIQLCQICDKRFHTLYTLKQHLAEHNSDLN